MGEISDDLVERQINKALFPKKSVIKENKTDKKLFWEQKDGKLIDIKDMSYTHIQNCINVLNKRINNDSAWVKLFKNELKSRRND